MEGTENQRKKSSDVPEAKEPLEAQPDEWAMFFWKIEIRMKVRSSSESHLSVAAFSEAARQPSDFALTTVAIVPLPQNQSSAKFTPSRLRISYIQPTSS